MKARTTIISIVMVYLVMFSLVMTFFHDIKPLLYSLMSIVALAGFTIITLTGLSIIIFNIYASINDNHSNQLRKGPSRDR